MSTITKERVAGIASGEKCYTHDDVLELARIALASLEAEEPGRNPVLAYADSYRDMAKRGVETIPVWSVITDLERNIAPLFTAAPATVDKNPLREFAMEYIESWELGMAGDSSLLASARKAIADSEILQPAPVSVPDDYFSSLVAAARVRADKAMRKFPQPNYVLNKVAEESGEVIKAVIHFTEGREEWQNVEGEIIDNLAMLIRLVMEGDQVIGFTPPDACRAAMFQGADGNSTVIPDGWVMVPIEPTEDMIINGFESEPDESFSDAEVWEAYDAMSGCQQAAHRAKLCWSAMISAAPKPDVR